MKELDFDELDKAVSSLMSNVPKDAPPAEAENTVTIPASDGGQSVSPTPPISSPTVSAFSQPTRSATSIASLATRRGGRFMDMVHPSADMKKTEPTKPVSRQGATIAPAVSEVSESPTSAEVPEPDMTPPTTSTPVAEEALSAYQPQAKSDWPDPLEMAAAKEKKISTEPPKEMSATDVADESTPLTSPFLPNTRVEKRPLGSPAQESTEPELSTPALGKEDLTVDNPDAQLPPAPSESEQPLPEELQGDLVAIESGSTKDRDTGHSEKHEAKEVSVPVDPEQPKLEEKPPAPSGPTSIPKQYKEEPSTSEQESGAIYDTDAYHQPLNHPAKKKSGWLWVLCIVLILAAGASTGAALVFFQII